MHLIGLTLGAENDWPAAFEALLTRAKLNIKEGGKRHSFATERVTYEPFSLQQPVRYSLVIDRAAWWYFLPREWLKKVAVMNDTYLLNNPFTFQSMEKHTAYCAMMRLGLRVPETWMLPYKQGPENERWATTAQRYNQWFNLEQIAEQIGYPLYMKPYDGGGWRGVTRVNDAGELHRAYDSSGTNLMHLQAGLADYEVFARALSIGPQTRVMRYRPERPMHERYDTSLDFMDRKLTAECAAISRLVNTFFRWEFNSCEIIIKDGLAYPIDYANACPDVALVSLHVHFPWAMLALLRWTVFCAATEREVALDLEQRKFFDLAEKAGRSYDKRLAAYGKRVKSYFQTERFEDFCDKHFKRLDEIADEYFSSGEFAELIAQSVREYFPPHEHEQRIGELSQTLKSWREIGSTASA